jgi:hypothetical protein
MYKLYNFGAICASEKVNFGRVVGQDQNYISGPEPRPEPRPEFRPPSALFWNFGNSGECAG